MIHIPNSKRICKIRATPTVPRVQDRKPIPEHFDCGLLVDDEGLYRREGGLKGTLICFLHNILLSSQVSGQDTSVSYFDCLWIPATLKSHYYMYVGSGHSKHQILSRAYHQTPTLLDAMPATCPLYVLVRFFNPVTSSPSSGVRPLIPNGPVKTSLTSPLTSHSIATSTSTPFALWRLAEPSSLTQCINGECCIAYIIPHDLMHILCPISTSSHSPARHAHCLHALPTTSNFKSSMSLAIPTLRRLHHSSDIERPPRHSYRTRMSLPQPQALNAAPAKYLKGPSRHRHAPVSASPRPGWTRCPNFSLYCIYIPCFVWPRPYVALTR